MMNKFVCFILIFFLVLGFGLAARAQTSGGTGGTVPRAGGTSGTIPRAGGTGSWLELPNPLKADTFAGLFAGIMEWVLSIVGLIAVGMIIYGGFQYMTSGGVETKTTDAVKTIRNAVIGLIIVFLSYAFLAVIKGILGIAMIKIFIA